MKIGRFVIFKTHKKNEPLQLCKERKRFIKSAIDSRHALAASHVSYIHSLRNLGIALRRFAEAEVLLNSSLSVSDRTPSQFTYPSPPLSSSSYVDFADDDVSGSPLHSENHVSCMRTGVTEPATVRIKPCNQQSRDFWDDEIPSNGASWDFFDPSCGSSNSEKSLNFESHEGVSLDKHCMNSNMIEKFFTSSRNYYRDCSVNCYEKSRVLKNDENVVVEDPSEFITHRAKDFLSSIKVIENRFVRAFESGREFSRLLEANKIMVGYSQSKGKSSVMAMLKAVQAVCYGKKAITASKESARKIISWRQIVPSQSSSSRNPLATTSKEDMDETESDFVEESCMISGSHSRTLDRLYAWERKLYDEVKACESIRKEYDRKCDQLRHQFIKDQGTQVIDRTRSVVKDLHARIIVAIYSFDSISKQIEKLRDEELLPQLLELNQGLIRMWRAMLECHHAQYITISLAYHSSSSTRTLEGDARREIMSQLLEELKCFGLSFDNWIKNHTSYVGAINTWLQNCILQPREHSSKKRTRPFSPRRVLAPPIFVLCRDWSAGIKALPYEDLSNAIKNLVSDLCHLIEKQDKELQEKLNSNVASTAETKRNDTNEDNTEDDYANLCCIHSSLTKVFRELTKFSEASLKMYEDIKQKSEAAQAEYHNCRSIGTRKI